MNNLVDFLSKLGSDPALAESYSKDPEATMTAAGLTAEQKALMQAGDLDAIQKSTGVEVKLITKVITSYK